MDNSPSSTATLFLLSEIFKKGGETLPDVNWDSILDAEDKLIDNSDRRFKRHSSSLERISGKLIYKASIEKYLNDLLTNADLQSESCLSDINNNKLLKALKKLTSKQRQIIELVFWGEMKQEDIAKSLKCKQSSVSRLLNRALKKLADEMMK